MSPLILLGLSARLPHSAQACCSLLFWPLLPSSQFEMISGIGDTDVRYGPWHVSSIGSGIRVRRTYKSVASTVRGVGCWSWRSLHTTEPNLGLAVNGTPAHLVCWSGHNCPLRKAYLVPKSGQRALRSPSPSTLHWPSTITT